MNEPILKDGKHNAGRLSAISHSLKGTISSTELKRKGSSLPKKVHQQEAKFSSMQGRYLVGWGRIPSLEKEFKRQLINKDITAFDCGEDHLIFLNYRNQAFSIGKNQFGQLGIPQQHSSRDVIAPVFESHKIRKIFCTPFCSFFITRSGKLYGCGLNNRGQLGLGYNCHKVVTPSYICTLSEESDHNRSTKKNSRNRINSVYYNEMKKSTSSQFFDKNGSIDEKMLEGNQTIKDIKGGPFHTVVLTSKGRLFYSGNYYRRESLLQDEFSSDFIYLNTSALGKIVAINSNLTGLGLLTLENKLYLLGHFGVNLFDEPQLISNINVISFGIYDQGILVVDGFGQVTYFDTSRSLLKGQRIQLPQPIETVACGLDYAIVISKNRNVFGMGNNSENQLGTVQEKQLDSFLNMGINFKGEDVVDLKCSNNFVLCLTNRSNICQSSREIIEDGSRCKELERQNKVLKELLCNKNRKNVKVQTDKQGKFQFSKTLNPRTFDSSMQIPFQQINFGKQISQGGYGVIYQGTWRKTSVAIKLFKIQQGSQNSIRDFISQCHAMQVLRHPNIVMFLGACTRAPHFAIVLQFCKGGTLWSLLQQKNIELTWQDRRQLALDTAKGMNYLHNRSTPILHRDLKSLNLLLDQNRKVKLADFGWTKGLENYMTGKIGTYQWMAPEVISACQYTQKADVYSFGIILWQIASREAPYRNVPGPQVAQEVLARDLRPVVPKKTPNSFVILMQECWSKDASKRPDFDEVTMRTNLGQQPQK